MPSLLPAPLPAWAAAVAPASTIDATADWLVRTSWQAAVLVVLVLALQATLGRRLAPRWRYALWMVVVVRLLLPAAPASRWSVFNLSLPSPPLEPHRAAAAPAVAPSGAPGATDRSPVVTRGALVATTTAHPVPAPVPHRLPPAVPARAAWRPALVAVWLTGVWIVLGRVVIGVALLRRKLRRGRPADEATLALLARSARELGLRAAPPLILTDAVPGPALFGFLRPRLLIPPRLIDELTPAELRFVLLHELAHHRRRDPLANALLVLAQAVHWFNPLARFALAGCRAERELACDAMVMAASAAAPGPGAGPEAYGRTVLRVAEAFRSAPPVPLAAVGMIHTRSQLRRRIAMIATFTPARSRRPAVLPALLVLCLASCALTDREAKGPSTRPSAAGAAAQPGSPPTAAALHAGTAAPTPAPESEGGVDPVLQAQLQHRLREMTLEAMPLVDVIDYFRKETTANIRVEWRALEAAGVDSKTPVNARMRNVHFAKALQVVLDDVGGDDVRLGYSAEGNVLTISTAEALARNVVTRAYDVHDLLVHIPDFTDAPELGRPRPLVAVAPSPQSRPRDDDERAGRERFRQEAVGQITTLLKDTVDPDSWRENGGTAGSIRTFQGQLIVTQTPENHRQVGALLNQLRETRAIQITVEARFLEFNPDGLPEAVRARLNPGPARPGEKVSRSFLSDEDAAAILRQVQADRDWTIVTAPRITLFNGQRAYVLVSTDRAFVAGYDAVKGGDGQTRYEARNASINSGVLLDVSATASADRKHVTLTVRPKLATLEGMTETPFEGPADAPKGLMVDHPQVATQSLQTTVSIPDGQSILLGGFVHQAAAPAADGNARPATRPAANMYMLLRPTLIIRPGTGG